MGRGHTPSLWPLYLLCALCVKSFSSFLLFKPSTVKAPSAFNPPFLATHHSSLTTAVPWLFRIPPVTIDCLHLR
jgi:hypothetical protein